MAGQHFKDQGFQFNWLKHKACLFLCAGYVIHKGYVVVHAGNVVDGVIIVGAKLNLGRRRRKCCRFRFEEQNTKV